MRAGVAFVAFTENGLRLAERLAAATGGSVRDGREASFSLREWTAAEFAAREALVFIGAAGIAVRAVAPFLRGKAADPAVLCLDEQGRYVIPLLSGHLGGANALARHLAARCGGTAVIGTATDINGVFAVDLWAKKQGMTVLEPERIKTVSAKLLRGESVTISCPWPIAGERPKGVRVSDMPGDAAVTLRAAEDGALHLVPRVLWLGIGCRRSVSEEGIETVFQRFCEERRLLPEGFCAAASIERKRDEAGLLRFCERRGLPLRFFTAEELAGAEGRFHASPFVAQTVGVDNVCERAAVLGSGGELLEEKYARCGVTLAAALAVPDLDWRW